MYCVDLLEYVLIDMYNGETLYWQCDFGYITDFCAGILCKDSEYMTMAVF